MIRKLLKLGRDERGTSVIELALVTPILASMVIGVIDLSRAYSTKLQLEQAAQRSIEKIQSGSASIDMFATLQAEAADAAGVPVTDVDVEYWLECDDVKQTGASMLVAYQQNCDPGETYARYIEVGIDKTYTPVFSTKFLGANDDGTYTLRGESGMRVQ